MCEAVAVFPPGVRCHEQSSKAPNWKGGLPSSAWASLRARFQSCEQTSRERGAPGEVDRIYPGGHFRENSYSHICECTNTRASYKCLSSVAVRL